MNRTTGSDTICNFAQIEKEVLDLWDNIDAFNTSQNKSEGLPECTFFNGPCFSSEYPDYTQLLNTVIKDIATRYMHQTGHRIERKFGWNCHGIPIEHQTERQLALKNRDDIIKMGITKYNDACRNTAMTYSSRWKEITTRLGRWVDFENSYNTMDKNYMESVWWVFKQIYEKGFLYKAYKVMPFSTSMATPLSNFEAAQNYKDILDPAVAFPLEEDAETSLLVWTYAPWTFPSALAVCVDPQSKYLKVFHKEHKKKYILAEDTLGMLFKHDTEYVIEASFAGSALKDKCYVPPFDFFIQEKTRGAFRVLLDHEMATGYGTGIFSVSPCFDSSDFRLCVEAGIIKAQDIICPIDDYGRFTDVTPPYAGKYFMDANTDIIKDLRSKNLLVKKSTYAHTVPFCWKSDTPLLEKPVSSWFIAVQQVKDHMLKNSQCIYFSNPAIKNRFRAWLENATDWCISRKRYWGTPMPIWASEDGEEVVVIGSVEELEKLSGTKVEDLHRQYVDEITIPSSQGKGMLRRIDEVLDCWFDTGCMPYASLHYPFENKDVVEKRIPADLVVEGLNETKGWFYTLSVISTILFDKPPVKDIIAHGAVLGRGRHKMSRRLHNYYDVDTIVDQYGADAFRLYLINSPVVKGDIMEFKQDGPRNITREFLLPWFNAYKFLKEAVSKFNNNNKSSQFQPNKKHAYASPNVLDQWILSSTNTLVGYIRQQMSEYHLHAVIPQLFKFVEQLTNWYLRLNRSRLKGRCGKPEAQFSLCTLFEVLLLVARVMSPFTPFTAEYFYQNMKEMLPEHEREDSIHYLPYPEIDKEAVNPQVERIIQRMQTVIQLGRLAREKRLKPLKYPLNKATNYTVDPEFKKDIESVQNYIREELNVRDFEVSMDDSNIVISKATLKFESGKIFRKDFIKVKRAVDALTPEEIIKLKNSGSVILEGHTVTLDNITITRQYHGDKKFEAAWDENDVMVVLDTEADEELQQEGLAREFANVVQKTRKSGIKSSETIHVFYSVDLNLSIAIKAQHQLVSHILGVPFYPMNSQYAEAIQKSISQLPKPALDSPMVRDEDGNVSVVTKQGFVLAFRNTWKWERFLWIGNRKEDRSYCHLVGVPREIIRYIASFL